MNLLRTSKARSKRESLKPKVVVILGPTASGKSDLAVKLAKRFNGEVISADSRQVYRGLDLGSGKVPRDRYSSTRLRSTDYYSGGIRHHLLDVASPRSIFTVQKYQRLTKVAMASILRRKKLPIICGGTGLYIDSVIYDTKFPEVPPNAKLRAELEKKTTGELFEMLKKLDPKRAETIEAKNPRRLIRAIEVVYALGHVPALPARVSTTEGHEKHSPYNVLKIGIRLSPTELKKRIERRLKARLPKNGPCQLSNDRQITDIRPKNMIQEVVNLHYKNGLSWKRLDDLGLEYRYISRYLRGILTYDQMKQEILKESYRYVKRQMTWFKKDKSIRWVR